jgi:hypothetical protein
MGIIVRFNQSAYRSDQALKLTVFAKYSEKGRAECSVWHCRIRHLDMLQLDHVQGNGKAERAGKGAGIPFYRKLCRLGFPPWVPNSMRELPCSEDGTAGAQLLAAESRGT